MKFQFSISNFQKLRRKLPDIKQNISLAEHTSFRIGGEAKYFFTAKTKQDLIKAVLLAKEQNIPYFILGGGSNILASDKGYNGLIIKCQTSGVRIIRLTMSDKFIRHRKSDKMNPASSIQHPSSIYAEAGVLLGKVVGLALENGLTGLEWAAGIPGTIGGAVRGNAGAFGECMADTTKTVAVLEIPNNKGQTTRPRQGCGGQANKSLPDRQAGKIQNPKSKTRIFSKNECRFGYRDSVFKQNPNLIILSAELELKKPAVAPAGAMEGKGNPAEIQEKIKGFLEHRRKSHPLGFPSAGSIFKNLKFQITNEKLLKEFPLLKEFNKKKDIPAGYLIDKAGLKGKTIGKAQISEKHANFIINLGGAKASDVLALINLVKQQVKQKFNLDLEEEIKKI